MYGFDRERGSENIINFKFKTGDYERCVLANNLFSKGYTINWSDEIFIISIKHPTTPPTYKIKSIEGESISKTFYEQELQKVFLKEFPFDTFEILDERDDLILIEKINSENSSPEWKNKNDFLNE